MTKTQEIVSTDRQDLTRWVSGIDLPDIEDSTEIQIDMAMRILEAATLEEALKPLETESGKTYVDKPFTLLDVSWRRSSIAGGKTQRYAIMHGVAAGGEKVTITSGAIQVMVGLLKIQNLEALPCRIVIRQADTPSASGGRANWIELDASPF